MDNLIRATLDEVGFENAIDACAELAYERACDRSLYTSVERDEWLRIYGLLEGCKIKTQEGE